MPSTSILVSAPDAIYIGDFGVSTVLTRITDLRTSGVRINEDFPTETIPALSYADLQSGLWRIEIVITFLGDGDFPTRLSRGLTISQDVNAGPGTSQYALLIVAPDDTITSSYYFPRVRTIKSRNIPYTKSAPTITEVTFLAEDRNPTVSLMYKNTPTGLASALGVRNPL